MTLSKELKSRVTETVRWEAKAIAEQLEDIKGQLLGVPAIRKRRA
jgi:hypothetical protein